MANEPLVICLPMPANLGNARMHWREKLRRKKDYWRNLDLIASIHAKTGMPDVEEWAHSRIPKPPEVPMDKARLRAHMVLGNSMDDDNAMARMKFALDWLVNRGYIRNDNRRCLKWEGIPTQEVSRKVPSHLRLTLTPGWE